MIPDLVWDDARALIVALAVAALVRMSVRVPAWRRQDVDDRFLWLTVVSFTVSTGYGTFELMGQGIDGGARIWLLLATFVYLHMTLTLRGRRRRRQATACRPPAPPPG